MKRIPQIAYGFQFLRLVNLLTTLVAAGLTPTAYAECPLDLDDAVRTHNIVKAKTLVSLGADVNCRNYVGNPILSSASSEGDVEMAELLISKGADVNAKGQYSRTALHFARNKRMAETLLARGAEVDAKTATGETPLEWAARGGITEEGKNEAVEIARVLVEHGADINAGSALNQAAYFNNLTMAKFLIDHGADPNLKCALCSAVGNGDYVEMAQLLVASGADVNKQSPNGEYPLHAAAFKGTEKSTRFLLSKGANPNTKSKVGFTPLYYAAGSNYGAASAEALLEYGADPNGMSPPGTALHQAAQQGATKVIEVLLANKADVDATNSAGQTPLYRAIFLGPRESARLLLEHGANPSAGSSLDGSIPLLLAISKRDLENVKQLVSFGADVNCADRTGATALDYAIGIAKSIEIARLLVAHKANVNVGDINGATPLHYAVFNPRQTGFVALLLEHGANVNAVNKNRQTPLNRAALNDDIETAKQLLSYGADVNSQDMLGHTALDVVRSHSRDRTFIDLLLAHGAKGNQTAE